jgi:CubicO group peptidase (beta-lactamase class C family)
MAPVLDVDNAVRLNDLFEMHVEQGLHHGAQLSVFKDGTEVVNVAGGTTGPSGGRTDPETPHLLFSCAKPLAAVCVHQLAERGAFDYDDPLRQYWPEFATPGTEKADITVRHVLSHQAGIPESEFDRKPDQWDDWDAAVEAMERVEVQFTPGTDAAYHAVTYGWLVGELVRRVTGAPIDEYAREHVFDPLGLADTDIGKPTADHGVATLVGYGDIDRCRQPSAGLEEFDPETAADIFNRDDVQQAVVPSSTAVGTASDLARLFACFANGGELDGTRILDEETVERATTLQAEVEHDDTLDVPRRYALGFERAGLPQDKYGALPPERVFGHGGLGSSVVWADPRENLAMAYVTNGVRAEAENRRRMNVMADAVRTAFETA